MQFTYMVRGVTKGNAVIMAAMGGGRFCYKGVDYEFIDETKKNLEDLVCPICHEILNDPLITNCGHLFCGRCLQQSGSRVKNCPVCRQEYTSMNDQFHARRIGGLKVKCPNAGKGCEWSGELRDAEGHVKTDSCQHTDVLCKNGCGEYIQRSLISDHETGKCPKRLYSCPHCGKEDTFDAITTSHYTLCEEYLIPCPNACLAKVSRSKLLSHLAVCPRRLVICRYRHIGCSAVLEVNDMEKHLTENKDQHMEMCMDTVVTLSTCVSWLLASQDPTQVPAGLVLSHQRPWLENNNTFPITPRVVKLEEYEAMKAEKRVWYSDPISTHPGGYQICLQVYTNGLKSAEDKYLSVYICLMRGEMDDVLKWPLTGKIRFSLLNQVEDSNHRPHTIKCIDRASHFSRVLPPKKRAAGLGSSSLVLISSLRDPADPSVQYLQNDCLYFKIETLSVT